MSEDTTPKITITRDGPYKLTGDIPVNLAFIGADEQGNSMTWDKRCACHNPQDDAIGGEDVYLCRCGHSRTKPFCDGSHDDAGFCGREKPESGVYAQRAEVEQGEAVNLMDDASLCVGARFCDVGASVWNYAEKSGDPLNLKMAIAESVKCPSGRLTVVTPDGQPVEPRLDQEISATQDTVRDCRGPLWVQGGIPIENHDGARYETRNRVTLCRCGASENQPFCDGNHFNCRHMQGVDSAES